MSLFASGRLPRAMASRKEMVLDNPNFVPSRQAPPISAPIEAASPSPAPVRLVGSNPLSGLGIFFLSFFLFFLFSRVLDFKFAALHLPLVFSSICLMLALAGGLRRALSMQSFQFLLGLTAWMIVCTPFSVWKGGSIEMLKDSWSKSLMAGFIVAALVQSSTHALRIMKVLAIAFLAAGLLGLVVGESMDGRLMLSDGSYSNPNDYAIAILYGCVCWYFMLHNPRSSFVTKIFSLGVIGFLAVMLLKTGSRGALITAAITFLPAFWRYSASTKLFVGLALPAVIVGGLLVLPAEMRNRYVTFFSDDNIRKAQSADEQEMLIKAQGSSQQRLQLAKDAFWLTVKNPLFGVGPAMFVVAQNDLSLERSSNKGAWVGTHNSYLQVSCETGIPGFLLFMGCLLTCWRDLRRLEKATSLRLDAQAQEIQTLAFSMRLLLISSFVFFFFEHIPFSPFVPVVACWIAAFSKAAREELNLQFETTRSPQAASRPRIPATPAWAR